MTPVEATKLMLQGCRVSGTRIKERGTLYLRNASFEVCSQSDFGI